MANEGFRIKRSSNPLPTEMVAGQILIKTDTGEMYVDNSNSERIKITDPELSIDDGSLD